MHDPYLKACRKAKLTTFEERVFMSYLVIARKYRPVLFKDVVGQEPVVKTLKNAIESGRIAHAYLFSGIRGIGKTTIARILAKALNCEKGPAPEPCGKCRPCLEVDRGESVDVIEIDGASNRKIENARELIEAIPYAPARDRFKIYIIDEVHMLTREAFNALLKTLEEPPSHIKFIFATTERKKVPLTILSRCQSFDFHPVPDRLISERLAKIAGEEGIETDDESIRIIVKGAGGSLRDAESLLDRVISSLGDRITSKEVADLLGEIESNLLLDMLEAVADSDTESALMLVERLSRDGVNLTDFFEKLMSVVRDAIVAKAVKNPVPLLDADPVVHERLLELSGRYSEEDLSRIFTLLSGMETTFRQTSSPRMLLEVAAVKMIHLKKILPMDELLRMVEGRKGTGEKEKKNDHLPETAGKLSLKEALKKSVERKNHLLSALLDQVSIGEGEKTIEIGITPESSVLQRLLQNPENLAILEESVEEATGSAKKVKEKEVAQEKKKKKTEKKSEKPSPKEAVASEPAVKTVLDAFDGRIVNFEDLSKGKKTKREDS